jgi:hypothetical protein
MVGLVDFTSPNEQSVLTAHVGEPRGSQKAEPINDWLGSRAGSIWIEFERSGGVKTAPFAKTTLEIVSKDTAHRQRPNFLRIVLVPFLILQIEASSQDSLRPGLTRRAELFHLLCSSKSSSSVKTDRF